MRFVVDIECLDNLNVVAMEEIINDGLIEFAGYTYAADGSVTFAVEKVERGF